MRTPYPRRHLLALLLVAWLARPAPLLAEPVQLEADAAAPPAAEASRSHFLRGYSLAERHDWAAALEAYRTAFELYPHATTLFNMGYCRAQLGDLVGAWYAIERALVGTEFDPNRRLSAERHAVATAQQNALTERLAVLHLGEAVDAAALRIDGAAPIDVGGLKPGTFLARALAPIAAHPTKHDSATRKIYLNPGTYDVTLTLDGHTQVDALSLAEGQELTLAWRSPKPRSPTSSLESAPLQTTGASSMSAPPPTSNPAPDRAQTATSSAADTTGPHQASEDRPLRTAGIVALAAAGAGFGVALGAGIVVVHTDRRLQNRCDDANTCPAESSGDVDRYQTAAHLTNIGLAVGVAGALTGVSLLWWDRSRESRHSLAIAPNGIQMTSRF